MAGRKQYQDRRTHECHSSSTQSGNDTECNRINERSGNGSDGKTLRKAFRKVVILFNRPLTPKCDD